MNVLVYPYGSNMVMPWLRQFVVEVLTRMPTFDSGPIRVALAMDAVALGQVLLKYLEFTCHCISIIAPHSYFIHLSATIYNLSN